LLRAYVFILLGLKPFLISKSFTLLVWFPCSSIILFFTVPPQASLDFKFFARSSRFISPLFIPSITVTSFPYRRLFTLMTIFCCSFATSSQTQRSLGNPQMLQTSGLIFLYSFIQCYILSFRYNSNEM